MDTNYLYSNGYPWHRDDFTDCLKEQKTKRININMASVILIDGGQGQGKTTLAIHIMDYFNGLARLPLVDLSRKGNVQLAQGGSDFISKFNKCKRLGLPVVAYDEAGDYSKASTLSYFNYQISKVFQKIRSAEVIILLMLPNFNILDNRLFDDEIIRGAIHCCDRQVTITHGNFKVYSIDQLGWVRYWYNKLPTARRHTCYGMQTPLFQCRFKNLPPARARQLEILTNLGKERERQMAEIGMRGLLSKNDLARELSKSIAWVNKMVLSKNIKPAEKFGTKNYYDKMALHKLDLVLKTKLK